MSFQCLVFQRISRTIIKSYISPPFNLHFNVCAKQIPLKIKKKKFDPSKKKKKIELKKKLIHLLLKYEPD